jgi:pyruvate dehydrogenase E2 component (dihydrolipoamide acetyltransferase)
MATLVPIPKLGQSEEVVSIAKWNVKEGDVIKKGTVLFEVETDKAVLEVESQFEGTLLKIVVPAGKPMPVMAIACVLGAPGEAIPDIPAPAAPAPKAAAPAPAAKAAGAKPAAGSPAPAATMMMVAAAPAIPAKPAISPRARAFAKKHLIDLAAVSGTGPSGRVTEADVKAYLEKIRYADYRITPAALELGLREKISVLKLKNCKPGDRVAVEDIELAIQEKPKTMSKMRQTIASRLQKSKQEIPHFYVTVSVDMTELLAYRGEIKKAKGDAPSVNDFVVKACALALREFPAVNSTTDGLSVSWNSCVNVGIAVNVENGLLVPVVKNTDRLSMAELAVKTREIATKARDGKLGPDELSGGTFTISNMGMLGVENFAAIINPGESAILAVSSTIPTPVVDAKRQVVVRDMMKITLSADHRMVDGALGAAFVKSVKTRLEDLAAWQALLA